MNLIYKVINFKKFFSYILYIVFASVSYANSDIKRNDESFHKTLYYSLMIGSMNSYSSDNADSVSCKTAAGIVALQNKIIKNFDPLSRGTAQDMITIAQKTNRECNLTQLN